METRSSARIQERSSSLLKKRKEPERLPFEQTCSICLSSFWDPSQITGCPANVCGALLCTFCAIMQHGIGVVHKSKRIVNVHKCSTCGSERTRVVEGAAPVQDPTPPRGGKIVEWMARERIKTWECAFSVRGSREWGLHMDCCADSFDSHEDCMEHMKGPCGQVVIKCPFPDCLQRGSRISLFQDHMPTCERKFFISPCQLCNINEDIRDDRGLHTSVCSSRAIQCPLCSNCDTRRRFRSHIKGEHKGIPSCSLLYSLSDGLVIAAATFTVSLGQQPTFLKVDAPGYHILIRVGGYEVGVDKNTSTIIPIVSSFGDIGREGNSSSIDDYIFSLWELESLNGFTRLPIHRFMSYPPSVDKSSVPFVVWTQQEMSCGEGVRTIELRFIDRHSSDDCIDL